ncbi:UNVERIFIED_CONTAM: hypothetical protein FKN15_034150 [Acipenser sinensis]
MQWIVTFCVQVVGETRVYLAEVQSLIQRRQWTYGLVTSDRPFSLVLLVHYCIAYPRSSSAVWVLLYQGCPNVLDYGSSASLHVDGQPPHTKFRRRFSLRTFQFLSSGLALDEEISFMCSTEVCSPDQRVCNEGCFDGRGFPSLWDPLGLAVPPPGLSPLQSGAVIFFLRDVMWRGLQALQNQVLLIEWGSSYSSYFPPLQNPLLPLACCVWF